MPKTISDETYKLEKVIHEAFHGIFVYCNGDITNWEILELAKRLEKKVKLRD